MNENVNKILDALADSHMHGWGWHREDSCYVYIKHINGKKPPHCRIRKDTAEVTMLNGAKFYADGVPIGWRLTADEFLALLESSKQNKGDQT